MYQKRKIRAEKKKDDSPKSFPSVGINWYPGHMKKTKDEVKKIMPVIDIVFEIIDARIPYSSKIKDIDDIIKNKEKILIMSKADLCDLNETNKWVKYYENKGYNVILVNLSDNNDYKKVIELVNKVANKINLKRKEKGLKAKELKALVIGVPNVGKSTLINNLAGKKVAKTGNMPGVTKSNVWLKTKYKVLVLDTPGILWPKFENENVALNLCVFSAIKEDVVPLMDVASYILKVLSIRYPQILEERFKITKYDDESFDTIAKNIGAIRNGEADYNRASKYIINEIKLEHIKGITFDYE